MIFTANMTLPAALTLIAQWRAAGYRTRIIKTSLDGPGHVTACRLC